MVCLKRWGRIFLPVLFPIFLLFFPALAFSQVLFEDDFNKGKSSAWNERNDGSVPGSFSVQNGQYIISSPDPANSLPRAFIPAGKNYFFQADLQLNPLNGNFASGSILAYYRDNTTYYELLLDGAHDRWSLQRLDKTGPVQLEGGDVPASRNVHTLGLYIKNHDIRAFIDGILVSQRSEPRPLNGGAFALSARGAETRWDNVRVRVSSKNIFFYRFAEKTSNNNGRVLFGTLALSIVDSGNRALPGIQVFRIDDGATSYFIFRDPTGNHQVRSGFPEEFPGSKVVLRNTGSKSTFRRHYSRSQTDWLVNLLNRSARFVNQGVAVDLRQIDKVFFRNGVLVSPSGAIKDSALAPPQKQTEANAIAFGNWDNTGNYAFFPEVSGAVGTGDVLIRSLTSAVPIPPNSKFSLFTLHLSPGSSDSGVFASWIVQEDSHGLLVAGRPQVASNLQAGNSYSVPFTINNLGEAARDFDFYLVLANDSSLGTNDTKLFKRSFTGMAAGGKIQSSASITIPSNIKKGHYFIGPVIDPASRDTKSRSGPAIPVNIGNFPSNGDMEFTLTWDQQADLDLHVSDPFSESLYYVQQQNATGGVFRQDAGCGGSSQTERAVYPRGTAASGTYSVFVHYFRSCNGTGEVRWTLNIVSDGKTQRISGTIRPSEYLHITDFTR